MLGVGGGMCSWRMLDVGCWMLDAGCGRRDVSWRMLDVGYWVWTGDVSWRMLDATRSWRMSDVTRAGGCRMSLVLEDVGCNTQLVSLVSQSSQ
jgi:hypothetical protein